VATALSRGLPTQNDNKKQHFLTFFNNIFFNYDNLRITFATKIFVIHNLSDMVRNKHQQPTESELEILQVLWQEGSGTVHQVHEALSKQKETGYTTTLKTMQIMTEKGFVSRDTSKRQHIYFPNISRDQCQQQFIHKMVDGLFAGSASRMVMGALDHNKLSRQEIREIREYLQQFENKES